MVSTKQSIIDRGTADFQRILDEVGDVVQIRQQTYSVGSIYGERINAVASGTYVTAELQVLDHRFIMDSAGKWEASDRMGYFKPTELSREAILGVSGGSQYFVNPSGTSTWYKVKEAFTEDFGAGSPIFTQALLKLQNSGAL